MNIGKPKVDDAKDYISMLQRLRDSLYQRTTARASTMIPVNQSQEYQNRLTEQKSLQNYDIDSLKGILADMKSETKRLQSIVEDKSSSIREKASAMTASKNRLNDVISDNHLGLGQKSDLIDDGINELDEAMKTKKNLLVSAHRLDSEIINTEIANRYLQIEQDVNHFTNLSENERKKLMNHQKSKILDQIIDRGLVINTSAQNLRELINEVKKLRKNHSDSVNLILADSSLKNDLKASLTKKNDDIKFLTDKIQSAEDELDYLISSDTGLDVEVLTEEVTTIKTNRFSLLNKLKSTIIQGFHLNKQVFDRTKQARHYEGLLEMASVNEEIMERNHLINIHQQTMENLEISKLEEPERLAEESKAIIAEQNTTINRLKEQYRYHHFY